jgi:16S rRNA A1518/A1519 N6-dimethyltransferase RsmA/KsgA/DIM1 with predicted DNA glycosylase/AP lyase activity
MIEDKDLSACADQGLEQYFLVSREKLAQLVAAGGVRPTDRVMEVGAGAGTVARELPPCQKLTLVEYDTRLIETIEANVPRAEVIQGDALELVRDLEFDVLFSNLPNLVTESLIEILPELEFRTAVLAIGKESDLSRLSEEFQVDEITTISGSDFTPPQPSISRIVRVSRVK